MGTLFEQPPRGLKSVNLEHIEAEVEYLIDIADKHDVDLKDVISVANLLEKRREITAYIQNGDIHDEQMGGLGKILINLKK